MLLKFNQYFIFALVILLFIQSCKKDLSSLGLNLQPESDKISGNTFDTVSVKAYTITEDSLSTDERSVSLLGSYTDPVFGTTDASFLTQIRLSTSNVTFGNSPTLDSMVLYLDYSSYYGDTNSLQNILVYEMNKDIYYDSAYYSNLNPSDYVNNTLIATKSYYPMPNDTNKVVSIKFDSTWATKFIDITNISHFTDNNTFLEWFKGIYVKTQSIYYNGAIIYYSLISSLSKITLYYKNTSDTAQKKFDFLINSSCARVNLFKHNYSLSTVNNVLNDSLTSDSLLYLQAMSGPVVKIKFPYLNKIKKDSTLAIVNAQLIIPVDDYDQATYKTPTKLLLVAYNSSGAYSFLPDYMVNSGYFDGNYYASDKTYRFNISRYVQELIDNSITDYGLALFVYDNRTSANRVILRGPKCISNKMRLSITYLKP